MCGYGPVILGYNHPEVEEAAAAQRKDGSCFNHPTKKSVELAEQLVEWVQFAQWCVFAKNGSDVTTWAIQVAREHTKRKGIVQIKGAYHGSHAWCTPGHGGLIEEDRRHIFSFKWNDLGELEELLQKQRERIAGLIITPFHHPAFADCEMPEAGFLTGVERLCREHGVVLILDDIRAGFRLSLGGSHEYFGFTPDIICFCKALGNGYPISAALGADFLRVASSKVFLTGSYWNNAVPIAAAQKTLEILKRDECIKRLEVLGQRLRDGLERVGEVSCFSIKSSGPPAVPFYRIAGESNFYLQQKFCRSIISKGVYFHPHHNWFMSAAHNESDIDETIQIAAEALKNLDR
jgi:glutamate-1-semialdehyde 2,1-aminomutase